MAVKRQTLRALRFRDLMPYRVAEVLLVSSPYDAFILEQDGQLTEQVFVEYADLKLPSAPRFTHAPTGEAALDLLRERHFDLVLTMTSISDIDLNAFRRQIRKLRPDQPLPVVLLALDRRELRVQQPKIEPQTLDGVFLWNGDPKILLAIIMYIEDLQNVDPDIDRGNVRVIIVLEDSPAYYSSFLGILYRELFAQARSLYAEGVNEILRQMYMKSRPKILLANSYERALELYETYRDNLLAVVSDVEVPRGGRLEADSRAGLLFARKLQRLQPDLPILVQSADTRHEADAVALGATFIGKGSEGLGTKIKRFVTEALGFGDFIFRNRDGKEFDRASDLREFVEKLAQVDDESLRYHATHNHFSIWLVARSEFGLAEKIRPRQVSEFPDLDAVRRYLIETLGTVQHEIHRGVVSDFSRQHFDSEMFSRLGRGALGGKARGLAFLNQRLADTEADDFSGMTVHLPKTAVLTVEHFETFLIENDLLAKVEGLPNDEAITKEFLASRFSPELSSDLRFIAEHMDGPLAIRSSSLLEDSLHQPLAGIYATVMQANNAERLDERARELEASVKLVYASVFWGHARAYLRVTGHRVEDEKMAVIIQPLIGSAHERRFYPTMSGVAQSHNYYPLEPQRAEDGVVHMALGLGRLVVEGGKAFRFCPKYPDMIPQLAHPNAFLDASQRQFFALDLDHGCCSHLTSHDSSVRAYGLNEAEGDGTLQVVGSVFSVDDQQIRDDLSLRGPRLITFTNILRYQAIPLASALDRLLAIGREGFGGPVEIEFAVDLPEGTRLWADPEKGEPVLQVLQIRPMALGQPTAEDGVDVQVSATERLCSARRSLGNGRVRGIRDLIYVRPDRWQAKNNRTIATEIGRLNAELVGMGRPYLLIGPGRWGSSDEWLGIPVRWSEISGAKVMVEASPADYRVEPSQGTHFFQNITALGIGYLCLDPGAGPPSEPSEESREDVLDWPWLTAQPFHGETEHLRWLRFDDPLPVFLDGRRGRGLIIKPGTMEQG